jgi:hypothetical protein
VKDWRDSPCIFWPGMINQNGYGRACMGGNRYAHVLVWEKNVGPVPADKCLDHLCRNRSCVNPAHLEVVTIRENTLRGVGPTAINAKKTHCVRGHELSEDNVYMRLGKRHCCACKNIRQRASRAKAKSGATAIRALSARLGE